MAVAVTLILGACVTQTAPPREALPDVAAAVTPPQPCAFVVGSPVGVRVTEVVAASGADGVLRTDDVIVGVDEVTVVDVAGLRDALASKTVGDAISVETVRGQSTDTHSVVLGPNPTDVSIPFIGVSIETANQEILASEVPQGNGVDGELSRLVQIGDEVFALDPIGLDVVALDVEPPERPWKAIDGTFYWVEGDNVETSTLVTSSGEVIELAGGARPLAVRGVLGDELIIAHTAPDDGVALSPIDPRTGEARWTIQAPVEADIPLFALSSPDESRVMVGYGQPDGPSRTYTIVLADDGTPDPGSDGLEVLDDGRVFGWFDDESLLIQPAQGSLGTFDLATGSVTPAATALPVPPDAQVRAVGDGATMLVQVAAGIVRVDLSGTGEQRRLISRCQIAYVDDPGSGTA